MPGVHLYNLNMKENIEDASPIKKRQLSARSLHVPNIRPTMTRCSFKRLHSGTIVSFSAYMKN